MRPGDERGLAFPSPLVLLSVVAVAMAGVAFMATQRETPAPEARTVAQSSPSASPTPTPTPTPTKKPTPKPTKKPAPEPELVRSEVFVEVYNNSGISGLAGATAAQAADAGWSVVGSDNWYGTIPASTVYYPARLEDAADELAEDLGITRTMPAVDPMRLDRLTVILTSDYS